MTHTGLPGQFIVFKRVSFLVLSFYLLWHILLPKNHTTNRAALLCPDRVLISLTPKQTMIRECLFQGHVHELLLLRLPRQLFVYVRSALLLTRQWMPEWSHEKLPFGNFIKFYGSENLSSRGHCPLTNLVRFDFSFIYCILQKFSKTRLIINGWTWYLVHNLVHVALKIILWGQYSNPYTGFRKRFDQFIIVYDS